MESCGDFYGTRLNKIYARKSHAWGRHKLFGSTGKGHLVFVGTMQDVAKISDSQLTDSGKLKPEGHGPDK